MRIIFALAAMAVSMNCVAAEFFVATNGCDGADGSASRPYRTIQRAADVAVAGKPVFVDQAFPAPTISKAKLGK